MKYSIYAAIILAGLCLSGCKPTEKNYQAAYDAARLKREKKAAADADIPIPASGLQSLTGEKKVELNGTTANLKQIHLKYIGEGDAPAIQRYNVAVARYKMPTNVRAHAKRLKDYYPGAIPTEGNDGYFYVVANAFDNLDQASEFIAKFLDKHKDSVVGLDDGILIIDQPRLLTNPVY